MAVTNFGKLTEHQKKVWSMDFWRQARNLSVFNRFTGDDENAVFQRITELKKTERGDQAIITLIADTEGDGVAGDRRLKGNEEALVSYDETIVIDQIRNAHINKGRMAEQSSVVRFRKQAKNNLAYWLSDRLDQMAFLTLSGVSYTMHNNGKIRIGSDLRNLAFASDVKAPTAKRVARWNGTSKTLEIGGATTDVTAADTPMWEMLVQAKAYAKATYMRGCRENGGEECYHVFLDPFAMAKLKLDETYMKNLRHATSKGVNDKLFTGGTVKVDGLYIHELRHVYNTTAAPVGSKWGTDGDVDGCQILFCGAQALAFADLGDAYWDEEGEDYGNQQGISIGKILGFKKPQFPSHYMGGTLEDHGVLSIYVAN